MDEVRLPHHIYIHFPQQGQECDFCGKRRWEGLEWLRFRWNRTGLFRLVPRVRWERLYESRDVTRTSSAVGGVVTKTTHLCSATCHRRWGESLAKGEDSGGRMAAAWGRILPTLKTDEDSSPNIEDAYPQAKLRWDAQIRRAREFAEDYGTANDKSSAPGMSREDYFQVILRGMHVPQGLWPEWGDDQGG
jgi:hypothetical protein